MPTARVILGDCRAVLKTLPAASFDCCITDPVYPCIPRPYGVWNEEEWFDLMNAVVPEVRRVLKPTGSAVFILQPNSEKAGRMRLWVWEFIATWGRKWGLVQDCYQWNFAQLPYGGATTKGLMRGSVKYCVWLGPHDCYRNQDAVLLPESEVSAKRRAKGWAGSFTSPSASKRGTDTPRLDQNRAYAAAVRRGGVTPFNLIPTTNTTNHPDKSAAHPARTSPEVARFWVKYLTKPGGAVLDPFAGGGTIPEVAADEGRAGVGIEIDPDYVAAFAARQAKRETVNKVG